MLAIFTLLYAVSAGVCAGSARNTRCGAEHGSARWGSPQAIVRRYRARQPQQNVLLTRNFRIGLDGHKHKRNLNVLVIGGSGAGKTRTYAVPNVMQCCCSLVATDPKSEILRKTGHLLKAQGYEVRVFDLISPTTSFCYNPFAYVHDDKDVLQLIESLIKNTTPPNSQGTDPFWTKSETALLQALMLYLLHEAPPEEQNFAMILDMIVSADVKEDDDEYESPLDILFARLAMRSPEDIAVKQYAIFKQAAGKTARSILISAGVRLATFNLPQIAALTATDDLRLHELGEKKIALFCCIPDSDASLNYLVGMIYTQLIQTLYRIADRKYKGRLPLPVHLLMDEYANLSLPKESFLAALGTMRSRNIFCSIILQNLAQIKAMYKDGAWESLVGLCDSLLYLGGNEKETHKYVSELLGKETLSTNTYGHTKGRNGSYSTNFQQSARELLTPDEVRLIDNSKAVLFVRGERPMLDDK
ncbi:MAG: type IV secretory system conjugative DNA transfer family protein, partial [Ruthenibacterium sp.]